MKNPLKKRARRVSSGVPDRKVSLSREGHSAMLQNESVLVQSEEVAPSRGGPSSAPGADDLLLNREIAVYIKQQLSDLKPYLTSETLIEVISKERRDSLFRICIRLTEAGSKVEAEGVGDHIFMAIRNSKERLLKMLSEIQDNVISSTERQQEINQILSGQSNMPH